MLEQEVKMLLSSCEYNLLVYRFPEAVSIRQVNYYFDTYDYKWHRNRVTCRIREKAGNFEATIKSHVNKSTGVSKEQTQQVQDRCDTSFFEDMNVDYQGKLVTERLCIMLADDIEVCKALHMVSLSKLICYTRLTASLETPLPTHGSRMFKKTKAFISV